MEYRGEVLVGPEMKGEAVLVANGLPNITNETKKSKNLERQGPQVN